MKKFFSSLLMVMAFGSSAMASQDCPYVLTPDRVVGVYEGGIVHTFPPESFVAHSRMTLHSDGTAFEQHETYQVVPTTGVSVLLSTSQGYWKFTGFNEVTVQFNVDASVFPTNSDPNFVYMTPVGPKMAGDFFLKSTVTWVAAWDRNACNLSGGWTGTVYTDYNQTQSILNSAGNITQKKLPPLQ